MKRDCRGFSLLEVLVAFVILALSLAVLMRIFSGGMRNIGAAEAYSRAVAIAESELATVGVDAPLAEGQHAGENGSFTWQTTVTRHAGSAAPTEGTIGGIELYQVEVLVNWGQAPAAARSVRFVTLRAASGAT